MPGTFTDVASLKATLDGTDEIGAMLLIDTVQHLAEPQELLTALSTWSLAHGSPPLVLTVPHVAHMDMALKILCGQFEAQEAGPLDPANLRFFTEKTLQRLVEHCGWRVIGKDDLHSLYSEEYDPALRDGLPEEMVAALGATAQAMNPNWSVSHFVWALAPYAIDMAPSTYGESVAPDAASSAPTVDPKATAAVAESLSSIGLVVSEANRRAVLARRSGVVTYPPGPKGWVLRFIYSSPGRAAAFRRAYARLR